MSSWSLPTFLSESNKITSRTVEMYEQLRSRNIDGITMGERPVSFCFRVYFKGSNDEKMRDALRQYYPGLASVNAISCSMCKCLEWGHDNNVIETALVGHNENLVYVDDLGYDDIRLHEDFSALVSEIERLVAKFKEMERIIKAAVTIQKGFRLARYHPDYELCGRVLCRNIARDTKELNEKYGTSLVL